MASVTDSMITPPALAKRWGVSPEKVLQLIHSAQLRAVNLAVNPDGKPRWRVPLDEVSRFELSRTTQPAMPKPRRRRRRATVTRREFF